MNQGRISLRRALPGVVCLLACSAGDLAADGIRPARVARTVQSSDRPNVANETDAAAGQLVDSLFAPFAPEDPLSTVAARALRLEPGKAARRPTWSARLVRNQKTADGNAPYALVDRYGGIQRYVEPVPGIDLDQYVGQIVAVRRDTGGELLASQLDLPRKPTPDNVVDDLLGVRLAALEEPLPGPDPPMPSPAEESLPGEIIEGEIADSLVLYGDEPIIVPDGVDPLYLDGNSEFGGCDICGDDVCAGRGCLNPCGFGSRPIMYVRGEYLLWWFDGMSTPPLVVRGEVDDNGTPANLTDDIFTNGFTVFGNESILEESRSGARIKAGYWLDDYGRWAIEGDYFGFGQVDVQFVDGGNGTFPIVGRPYIDDTTGLPAVEDVSFPGIAGTVVVDAESSFQSAGIRFRRGLCCIAGASVSCGDCVTCGSAVGCDGIGGARPICPILPAAGARCAAIIAGGTRRVDVLYGFRWAELDESLSVTEDLQAIAPSTAAGTTFSVRDQFDAKNEFVGGEIGFLMDWERRRWSLEFLTKLAIGNTRQRVRINGNTTITEVGDPAESFPGFGLLAQPSNVGTYERDEFSVLPEIGVTAGYMVTQRLRLTFGYTLLYWSQVVRPGDQIDLNVNPQFLDLPADPAAVQPQSPAFVFRETDLWAHGFNAGLEYRW